MIDKNSEEYNEGFKDGIAFTSNHLVDMAYKFRRNMLEIIEVSNKIIKEKEKNVNNRKI